MLQSDKIQSWQFQQKKPRKLWQDSPCSHNYVSNSVRIDLKTPRFEFGSIYYKDEVDRQKKVFNEFQKPDILLHEFRRQILEVSRPKCCIIDQKNKKYGIKNKYRSRSVCMTVSTSSHLYQIPKQTALVFDRNGFRTFNVGQFNVKEISAKVKQNKGNFSFGRRIDFSRPLNFHPGAGAYESLTPQTQRSAQKISRTCHDFFKRKKMSQTPQPEQCNENQQKGKKEI